MQTNNNFNKKQKKTILEYSKLSSNWIVSKNDKECISEKIFSLYKSNINSFVTYLKS